VLHFNELSWSNYLSIFHILRKAEGEMQREGGREGERE
jgi:hypothetical protein